jgi:hypothetical protein
MQMLKIVNPHKYFVAQACRQNKEKPQLSSAARFLPTCFSLMIRKSILQKVLITD